MIGAGPIGVLPIASLGEVVPIYRTAVAFVISATMAVTPAPRVFSGQVAFSVSTSLAATPHAVYSPGVAFNVGIDLQAGPSHVASAAVAFTIGTSFLADNEFRLFVASDEFITRPTDARPNYPFDGTLQTAMRFDRTILNGGGIGQVTTGWGEMELNNAAGEYDYLIDKYSVDGRRITLKVGAIEDGYDSFITLFDLTAKGWHVEEDAVRIQLRDRSYVFEVPAQSAIYGGTGNLDGDENLKGKRKPWALGECANVTPQPLSMTPAVPIYQVSGGRVLAVPAVYDRAIALTPATVPDYATSTALLAATDGPLGSGAAIEAGEFATCLAEGLIRLGGTPLGLVTCDVKGDNTGGVYVDTTIAIIRRLALLADPTVALDAPALAAAEAKTPAVIGYYLATGSEATYADVIADLIGGVGGWAGHRRNGQFTASIFTAPTGGVPTAYYTNVEIVDIARERLPEALDPPPWRQRATWGRNWTVQDDLTEDPGTGLTSDRLAFLREAYRVASSSEAAAAVIKSNHPLAQDPSERQAYFRDEAPAEAFTDDQLALFSQVWSLYRLELEGVPFIHDVGDIIHVTYPRWDLSNGRLLRIVSITETADSDGNSLEIVGFG